jgi:type II secretory pathway predicted ATPase ExeA
LEHLEHFGLSRDPFSNETQVDLFFASEVHADCQRRLTRCVQQAKGRCLVTGRPGCGKTMTLRHFFESLDEDHFEPCLLVPVPGVSDRDWVLCRFAAQLGIEEVARERSEVLGQIYEALTVVREEGRHTVLMIDEAQLLADGNSLGELRGLLNLEYENRRLISLILDDPLDDDDIPTGEHTPN